MIHNPASLTATAIEGGPIVILGPDMRYDISMGDPLAIPCITSDLSLATVTMFIGSTPQEIHVTPLVWGVNYEVPSRFYNCGVEGFTQIVTGKSVWGEEGTEREKEAR